MEPCIFSSDNNSQLVVGEGIAPSEDGEGRDMKREEDVQCEEFENLVGCHVKLSCEGNDESANFEERADAVADSGTVVFSNDGSVVGPGTFSVDPNSSELFVHDGAITSFVDSERRAIKRQVVQCEELENQVKRRKLSSHDGENANESEIFEQGADAHSATVVFLNDGSAMQMEAIIKEEDIKSEQVSDDGSVMEMEAAIKEEYIKLEQGSDLRSATGIEGAIKEEYMEFDQVAGAPCDGDSDCQVICEISSNTKWNKESHLSDQDSSSDTLADDDGELDRQSHHPHQESLPCTKLNLSDSSDSDIKTVQHLTKPKKLVKKKKIAKRVKTKPIDPESCDEDAELGQEWLFQDDDPNVEALQDIQMYSATDRLVLDFDRDTNSELVSVNKNLVANLKPHQMMGIKFMWHNCFKSAKEIQTGPGSGCILAHSMGLGKTLQVITLVHTLLTHKQCRVRRVLVMCPVSTILNWVNEFAKWLPGDMAINVYELTSTKNVNDRQAVCQKWYRQGGVLITGYAMYRNLRKLDEFRKTLVKPGPDLVICDEGHVVKNGKTSTSKALNGVKTKRRIILTGTPLQNNLLEYHSMMQIVNPKLLGPIEGFKATFADPIKAGQGSEATAYQVSMMNRRAFALHKLMKSSVQRFDYSILKSTLPAKLEYVISVRLSARQVEMYRHFLEFYKIGGMGLLMDFQELARVWTHPKALPLADEMRPEVDPDLQDEPVTRGWWRQFVHEDDVLRIEDSGKFVLLMEILRKCQSIGDKALVFSQSLVSLNLMEQFLKAETTTDWELNADYFRLDGNTPSDLRNKWCHAFNDKNDPRARLFLISTRAGGAGINLVGANRVVIFDASWNPTNDIQSIFRVYRYGQQKPCYVYRFISEGTMEKKIYQRQVLKESLAHRVVDAETIERHFNGPKSHELYEFDPEPQWLPPLESTGVQDCLMKELVDEKAEWITSFHLHDSLLANQQDQQLTAEERKKAWDEALVERKINETKTIRKQLLIGKEIKPKSGHED